jgi:hypothetical protein
MKEYLNLLDFQRVLEVQVRLLEVFIQETDFAKTNPVIEEFRLSI